MTEERNQQPQPNKTPAPELRADVASKPDTRDNVKLSIPSTTGKEPVDLARVKIGDQWGLITRDGNFVAQPTFAALEPFSEGRCAFCEYGATIVDGGGSWDGSDIWTGDDRGGSLGPHIEGKWGFLDRTGAPIIAARFNQVRQFSEGLAAIQQDQRWGFINRAGDVVIEPQFRWAGDFRSGLCAVSDSGFESERYIDGSGSDVFRRQFVKCDEFCGRIARVEDAFGYRGYINTRGEFIFRRKKKQQRKPFRDGVSLGLGRFVDGVAYIRGKRRVSDLECLCSSEPDNDIVDSLSFLSYGLIGICKRCSSCLCEQCEHGTGVFLNSNGDSILAAQSHLRDPLADFSCGLGLVGLRASADKVHKKRYEYTLYGFVNTSGQIAIGPGFVEASSFHDGYASVKLAKDSEWVQIDTTGKMIPTELLSKRVKPFRFSEGLAVFMGKDCHFGFVDTDGKVVIEPRFGRASLFSGGLAVISLPETSKYGYINNAGDLVIPYQFDEAMDFEAIVP